ncbi:hypothetical protein [uncultured Eubacterium sp.]|uniref:hypothetical protein n=1 Tax=uncultured Eubacterium sp. TaxID=165185 RepID=UPI0026741899|nr:hypothetical protein [uncultured Eubacterium sp.]
MKKSVKLTYNSVDSVPHTFNFEGANVCPICKTTISPVYIASSLNSYFEASVFNYCQSCNNTFISKYSVRKNCDHSFQIISFDMDKFIISEPYEFDKKVFEKAIVSLSPQFDKIYNQALAAESSRLDEIAGIGFRKALEFLIKDFAIHKFPDNESKIKSMSLAQCINFYIDDSRIKILATRSAWLGNDEAHYLRKQDGRDINDMKHFIDAIVYFISMVLITEDAATIESK